MKEIAFSMSVNPAAPYSTTALPGNMTFEALVEIYWPRVFRFALASLRDRDAAETIAQDCFVRAHRALSGFRNECSCQSWLMKITVNLIRDHARNRRLQFWRKAEAAAPSPEWAANLGDTRESSAEERALVRERLDAVWSAAENLPERQRTVFLLRFVEDMDLLEIASSTGMKEGTVKTHLFRALHAVRERIGATS